MLVRNVEEPVIPLNFRASELRRREEVLSRHAFGDRQPHDGKQRGRDVAELTAVCERSVEVVGDQDERNEIGRVRGYRAILRVELFLSIAVIGGNGEQCAGRQGGTR